jgi:type II secretory pathway pseudopilin PulG
LSELIARRAGVQSSEAGLTLIETMVAAVVLLVGVVAMMGMFGVAVRQNQDQGRLAVQTATYCQNKLQELESLKFLDSSTDTSTWPPASSGGTGLCGDMAPGTTCGGIDPASPVSGFVDYLDSDGNPVTGLAGAAFVRQWQIVADATGTLKTITVLTQAVEPSPPPPPTVTLVAIKTNKGT